VHSARTRPRRAYLRRSGRYTTSEVCAAFLSLARRADLFLAEVELETTWEERCMLVVWIHRLWGSGTDTSDVGRSVGHVSFVAMFVGRTSKLKRFGVCGRAGRDLPLSTFQLTQSLNMDEIVPNLWLGSYPGVRRLRENVNGIQSILSILRGRMIVPDVCQCSCSIVSHFPPHAPFFSTDICPPSDSTR
jgi:hypothetical protein